MNRLLLKMFLAALLVPAAARADITAVASPAEKITIEMPLFEGGAGKDFFLQCARAYEKLKPNVKVDLYLDPRIQEKVQVRFLEGSFFECTNVQLNYWPLIRNGDVVQVEPQ